MTDKLTLGVLGLGEGRSIISACLESELWELGNICDIKKGCKAGRRVWITKYTTSYQDMPRSEIDVIEFTLPTTSRRPY